jgi:hypothetical protein
MARLPRFLSTIRAATSGPGPPARITGVRTSSTMRRLIVQSWVTPRAPIWSDARWLSRSRKSAIPLVAPGNIDARLVHDGDASHDEHARRRHFELLHIFGQHKLGGSGPTDKAIVDSIAQPVEVGAVCLLGIRAPDDPTLPNPLRPGMCFLGIQSASLPGRSMTERPHKAR